MNARVAICGLLLQKLTALKTFDLNGLSPDYKFSAQKPPSSSNNDIIEKCRPMSQFDSREKVNNLKLDSLQICFAERDLM